MSTFFDEKMLVPSALALAVSAVMAGPVMAEAVSPEIHTYDQDHVVKVNEARPGLFLRGKNVTYDMKNGATLKMIFESERAAQNLYAVRLWNGADLVVKGDTQIDLALPESIQSVTVVELNGANGTFDNLSITAKTETAKASDIRGIKVLPDTSGDGYESVELTVNGNLGMDLKGGSVQGLEVRDADASTTIGGGLDITVEAIGDGVDDSAVAIWNMGILSVSGDAAIVAKAKTGKAVAIDNGVGSTLAFAGTENFIQGEVKNNGELFFSREDGKSYTLIDGNVSRVSASDSHLVPCVYMSNGVLEVTGTFQNKLTLTNGTFIAHSDHNVLDTLVVAGESDLVLAKKDAKIEIAEFDLVPDSKLSLNATGELNDALGGNANELLKQVTFGNDPATADKFEAVKLAEGAVMGVVTMDKTGKITEKANTSNIAKAERLSNQAMLLTRVQINELRKRMGDVRMNDKAYGAWARVNGGSFTGANAFDADFTMVQAGADTRLAGTDVRVGGAFSYAKSEADDRFGSADSDAYSLAAYGVWANEAGLFTDVIARVAEVDTDMTEGADKAKVDGRLYSLSGEFGAHRVFGGHFFVEPSVELTYTYSEGDEFRLGGADRKTDDAESLIGRFGFALGKSCPSGFGDVYVRAGLVHEFMGDARLTSTLGEVTRSVDTKGNETWVEYAVGGNVKFNKDAYLYVDLERTEGASLEEDWRANLGVRVSF